MIFNFMLASLLLVKNTKSLVDCHHFIQFDILLFMM